MKSRCYLSACFLLLLTLISCSKWDDYKKYNADGEINYAGKIDSLAVFSGKLRVKLTGVLSADPKLIKCKITWNSGRDSTIVDMTPFKGIRRFEKIFDVDEGVKSFSVQTFDNNGNASLTTNVTGTSYGAIFRRRITNRPVTSITSSAGNSTIVWDGMDLSTGPQYVEIQYGDTYGRSDTSNLSSSKKVLSGFNINNSKLRYRTIYKPDIASIDTFATAYKLLP